VAPDVGGSALEAAAAYHEELTGQVPPALLSSSYELSTYEEELIVVLRGQRGLIACCEVAGAAGAWRFTPCSPPHEKLRG
jgi:hypothetical protein